MKIVLAIAFLCLLAGCDFIKEPKFVRKKIGYNDIRIRWYFEGYITSTSADMVVVEKKGEKKIIYEAVHVILNVTVKNDSITLKVVPPGTGLVYTKKMDKEVFNYKIVLDTTGTTTEDLRYIPDGIKECN